MSNLSTDKCCVLMSASLQPPCLQDQALRFTLGVSCNRHAITTTTTSGRTCRVAHEEMKMSQRASMTDESPTSSLPRKITPCFVALTSSLTFRSRPPLSSSWRTDGLTRSHDLGRRRKCRRPRPLSLLLLQHLSRWIWHRPHKVPQGKE